MLVEMVPRKDDDADRARFLSARLGRHVDALQRAV